MNVASRPWIGLVFKLMAVLAAIFAFIFFMRMQEEQSSIDRYRNEGTVSRAVIADKNLDKMIYEGRRGRTRSVDIQVLQVRFVPKSPVKYSDYVSKPSDLDLPTAPALSGDVMKDSEFSDVMFVSRTLYDSTKIGDTLTVVDTPYSGDGPELIADIKDFDPSSFYPNIAISLVLMLLFGFIGWRISKASAARSVAEIAKMPGTFS